MSGPLENFLSPIFRFIIAKRWWVLGIYAILLGISIPFALEVEQDNAIDRLIVKSDPDYLATRDFGTVFGGGEYVVLFAETEKPFSPDVIAKIDDLDKKLHHLPKVSSNSVFSIYRNARPDSDPKKDIEDFKKFASGTKLFTQQGLVGEGFYGIPLIMDVKGTAEREATLETIEAAVEDVVKNPAPLTALRRVGEPYLNAYLNVETAKGGMRLFPVFALFVILLVVWLYRSFRTLIAFIVSMAVNVALCVGYIGLTGGNFSIVSALIPMTILVTCLANLVYVHSRFIERPPDRDVDDHQIFALSNKFLACSTSVLASAVGFAALLVSDIRPIREMGVWVAIGLVFTWLISFTLFPALQKILKTPTQVERKTTAQWFMKVVDYMPRASYRYRWYTVLSAIALCGVGLVSLFGIPGYIQPMKMLTNQINYINPSSQLYKDTRRVEQIMPGLSMVDIWLKGKVGTLNQPEVIKGLDHFQNSLEKEPLVGSAVGPTTILRMLRYVGGKGDKIPDNPEELEALTDNLETLVNQQPLLSKFVDPKNMSQTHITLVTRINEYPVFEDLGVKVDQLWKDSIAKYPALKEFGTSSPQIVGLGRLQTKVAHNLVPTLVESFALTVGVLFLAFLVVFRNGAARLMAMLPSLFAILVMFAFMRLVGMSLSIATILIASTVLGTSENDQIHFFYHFLEGSRNGTTEKGLRHTTYIAGRSIFFATMINAIGFLAFALNDLPPIRQFAILAALAFTLSMIADFTALPGALWLVFKDKPDALKEAKSGE
jgi:predicted RND superfamily exporter protein